jgi:hypothetical protein
MKYKSFKEEKRLCLQRFKKAGTKIGDLVLFFHHGEAMESLPETPEKRLAFFPMGKRDETEKQWAIRAHWFRPIPKTMYEQLPQKFNAALKKYYAAREKYYAAWEKYSVAWEKYDAAREKYSAALKKYDAAREKYAPEITALIKKHYPDCPWDGETLFPRKK